MSPTTWALFAALLPGLLGTLGSRALSLGATSARRLTVFAAAASLGLGLLTAASVVAGGAPASATFLVLDPDGLDARLSLYVDPLTCVMLVMVGLVGTVVSLYAVRYLDGDPDQARFSRRLSFTLSAVLLLVVSGNLILLWLAWVASSLGLHTLLTHYGQRPAARLAARKKFFISRIGDVFLLFGFLLLHLLFGTVEYTELFAAARDGAADQPWATLAGVFLVLGAITKSAQLPVHSWLPDTMETPTPVSAFMHAGIINAGGFLLIRLGPVLGQAPLAMGLLAVVGATTAVFASVVMLTQTDIKRKLAYSTVAQMGFMMLQIGLGAYTLAVLHIVGHSFYKAHAFSSAGSVIRARRPAARPAPVSLGFGIFALALSGLAVAAATLGLGLDHGSPSATWVLHGVLAVAMAQMLVAGRATSGGAARGAIDGLLAGVALAGVYFVAGAAVHTGLAPAVVPEAGALATMWAAPLLALFVSAYLLQLSLPKLTRYPWARSLYIHAYNGFYLGVVQDRFIERLWPARRTAP